MPQILPALGRTHYCIIDRNSPSIETDIFNLLPALNEGKKIRILYDDQKQAEAIETSLKKLQQEKLNSLVFKPYQTIFYHNKINKEGVIKLIESHSGLNWKECDAKQGSFKISAVTNIASPEYVYIEDLYLNSNCCQFITKIDAKMGTKTTITPNPEMQEQARETLPRVIQTGFSKVFLITQQFSDGSFNVVGCLALLPIAKEVQLHGVSGKTSYSNTYKGKKLPILMAAMLNILQNQTEYGLIKPDQEPYLNLTFSNKDAKTGPLYQNLGFKVNPGRFCFLAKNNLQAIDIL